MIQHQVRRDADGTVHVTTELGHQFTLHTAGNIESHLSVIKTVGIRDICDVRSHAITNVLGSCSHVVHFHSGGLLCFAYNSAGDVLALTSDALDCHISRDNKMLFYPHVPGATAAD